MNTKKISSKIWLMLKSVVHHTVWFLSNENEILQQLSIIRQVLIIQYMRYYYG